MKYNIVVVVRAVNMWINNFRNEKNFTKSDEIRDKLAEIGVILKDGSDGTSFIK